MQLAPQYVEQLLGQVSTQAVLYLPKLITGVILFLVFWIVAATTRSLIIRLGNHSSEKQYVYRLLASSIKMVILSAGLITALGTMGVNVSALVASLGLVGFALGIALKDPLSNMVAGFLVLFYQPFKIGQHIKVGAIEGEVIDVNLRYTVLHAKDQETMVPNSTLLTSMITVQGK